MRSGLWADELVERRDGFAPRDADRVPAVLLPGDFHQVERSGEDAENVAGHVAEEIARVLVTLDRVADAFLSPVDDAAAVRVNEPANERTRILTDKFELP